MQIFHSEQPLFPFSISVVVDEESLCKSRIPHKGNSVAPLTELRSLRHALMIDAAFRAKDWTIDISLESKPTDDISMSTQAPKVTA